MRFLPFFLLFTWVACAQTTQLPIIPLPQKATIQSGSFQLNANTTLSFDLQQEQVAYTAQYLRKWIEGQCGYSPALGKKSGNNSIVLELSSEIRGQEAYRLKVGSSGITIQAWQPAGLFYGVQSLIQLFPVEKTSTPSIPAVEIVDEPTFAYRGLHLDVGRHFFPVDFVKSYIDILARYKLNRFHWHLTEDQGWRIEIKKYPRLQEIAAFRDETLIGHYNDQPQRYDGKRYGGFYTQAEVREIVAYARERFVTIIPEIEMPGHAQAAIAAYPELGCTGKQLKVSGLWGVSDNVFSPNEATFTFLENVLKEVMELFPSTYIHIGGDECPKDQWKTNAVAQALIKKENLKDEHGLQSYFIRRIEKFLNQHGRQIIGWDEILEGGLAPNATVMSWRGEEGGIEAAKAGHPVIMTPTTYCYLDYYQSQHPDEPLAIGGNLPLEKVYGYHPIPAVLNAEQQKLILGVQGNQWTEYISTPAKAQYMTYPRMQAIAEIAWTPRELKNFDSFVQRLIPHMARWKSEGISFGNHLFDVKTTVLAGDGSGLTLRAENPAKKGEISYQFNGQALADRGNELKISKSGTYTAQTLVNGKTEGRAASVDIKTHLASGKKISLSKMPSPSYPGSGVGSPINGVMGSSERYGDAEWLGYNGDDFEALIDLGSVQAFKKMSFRFFHGPGQWIYAPKTVQVSWSNDGKSFSKPLSANVVVPNGKIANTSLALPKGKGRYVKVLVPSYGVIPAGQAGAGSQAWLFVDELVLE
jgi:hexosaminidase